MPSRKDGKEEVLAVEAARRLGITPQAVGQWAKRVGAPVVQRKVGQRLVWPDFPRWWVAERERAIREECRAPSTDDAELRLKAAQAELQELKLAREKGLLVPASEYEAALDRFLGRFSAVASGQLARYERDIVAATSPAEARKITLEIQQALMRGAQDYADTIERESAEVAA